MSKGYMFRSWENEHPAAADEAISAQFERTKAQYDAGLSRSKDENHRKQRLPHQALSRIVLSNQDFTAWIKEEPEEQSVTLEDEQLPGPVQQSSDVCVKKEESSLGEDISSDSELVTERHTELSADSDNNDDWKRPMETEVDGAHYNPVQIRHRSIKLSPKNQSAAETSATVDNEDMPGPDAAERNKHMCPFCQKRFSINSKLQSHIRVHTGERPFDCWFCDKAFGLKKTLDEHIKTHTGKKPFKCSTCKHRFAQHSTLVSHTRTHTGEKPYSCSLCKIAFAQKGTLNSHMKTHTGEKPFRCPTCDKAFAYKYQLQKHMSSHRAQTPEDNDMQSVGRIFQILSIPFQSI